jgi:DNA-binding NarL/FixJ family response regulator
MIRVLVADDHPVMRKGIRGVLEDHQDVCIVGEASNGLEAVSYARSLEPMVVIMDISMPIMDGVQATRLIKQTHPGISILGLSVNDSEYMKRALLAAGAVSYMNKRDTADRLYHAIVEAVRLPRRSA